MTDPYAPSGRQDGPSASVPPGSPVAPAADGHGAGSPSAHGTAPSSGHPWNVVEDPTPAQSAAAQSGYGNGPTPPQPTFVGGQQPYPGPQGQAPGMAPQGVPGQPASAQPGPGQGVPGQ
ncbi:MAG: hypothetical protein WCA46_22785, partial [Actinocatenispora sp.]